MAGDNKPDKLKHDNFLAEGLQEIAQDSKELQDEIQCFEYKNKSKNGEYYVFSYNTIAGEKADDIKRKYNEQYGRCTDLKCINGGCKDCLLITDVTGKELDSLEFKGLEKIYLKTKISNHPKPIEFKDVSKSGEIKKSCTIKFPGWDTTSVKQIYKDEFNKVIENDRLIIMDEQGNVCDDNHKFKVGETIQITTKATSFIDVKNGGYEYKEKTNRENKYKQMIERQKGPITRGNSEKLKVSLTIDDGNGAPNIRHILDTLRGSGIHATFFILGTSIRDNSTLWKQAIEEGHQVCCHTYSHIYLSNKSDMTDLRNSLKKDEITKWENDVKNLLGLEYYNRLKLQVGNDFPYIISSPLLLRTEILMWEAQIKKTLGESYLKKLKSEFPFFRFPGGNGRFKEKNIKVLKDLGYLSVGWSDDFYRGTGENRKHISIEQLGKLKVSNGDIPLFHFKESDFKYIDAYIKNMKSQNKSSHLLTETLTNK